MAFKSDFWLCVNTNAKCFRIDEQYSNHIDWHILFPLVILAYWQVSLLLPKARNGKKRTKEIDLIFLFSSVHPFSSQKPCICDVPEGQATISYSACGLTKIAMIITLQLITATFRINPGNPSDPHINSRPYCNIIKHCMPNTLTYAMLLGT